ncbi:hypothetical protein RJT34_15861 [Clitoria ternatea]|uniref:Uncharacterized protein n=1 Tax=Clitoria ternatea TaxID=43366 RepID=A0AAN9PCD8_CLITE
MAQAKHYKKTEREKHKGKEERKVFILFPHIIVKFYPETKACVPLLLSAHLNANHHDDGGTNVKRDGKHDNKVIL